MKRLNLRALAGIAGIAAVGLACVACGSGHQPKSAPRSTDAVVHHSRPAVPVLGRPIPADRGGSRSATRYHRTAGATTDPSGRATGHRRTALTTTGPSGMPNFRLPRNTHTIVTGCRGGKPVHVVGRRPVPVRDMCPHS